MLDCAQHAVCSCGLQIASDKAQVKCLLTLMSQPPNARDERLDGGSHHHVYITSNSLS